MKQRSAKILDRQVAQPEEKQRGWNDPVGQHGGEHRFKRGHGRAGLSLPAEMPPHETHQIPRSVFFERLPVRKHRGQRGHAAPQTQQQKVKAQRKDQKNDGPAEVEPGGRQHVSELGKRNRRRVQEQPNVGGVNNQHAAEETQAQGQKIEPARHFGGITNRFGTVHRGNGFGKDGVKKVRSAQAAKPQAVRPVNVGAH